MTAEIKFQFATAFRNSVGTEIAGTWFEEEIGAWRLSTVPIRSFPTEQDAIAFYRGFCDPETGLQTHAFRTTNALISSLKQEVERAAALKEKRDALLAEFREALGAQREAAQTLKRTVSRSDQTR